MTAELLARLGGPVAAAGLALVLVATPPRARLAGLALWLVGMALFLPLLLPPGGEAQLALVGAFGLAGALALAVLFRRRPWALALVALAAVPARVPIAMGDTSASLLIPLYAVVAGAGAALAWALWTDRRRGRELGPIAWPLAALVVWFGVSALWTGDIHEGAIELFFFVLPFGLLAAALASVPWERTPVVRLYGLLAAMAVLFAAVGIWQWLTRDVFWNPKVIVGNAYAPFYRVNSLFWDPSIYGRFLVVAILVSLALILFHARPRFELPLAAGIVFVWTGLLFSFSQSSFVALAFGVVLAAALAWRWRAAGAVALVAAVMIPLGVAAPQLEDVRSNVFASSTSALNRATSGRFDLVRNGLRIAAEHPFAGVGIGGFKRAYADLHEGGRDAPRVASHNTPVTVAAETGVVGSALFLWLLAAVLATAFRGNGDGHAFAARAAVAAGLALTAILVHSLFYNAFFEDPLTWGLLALIALAAGAREREAA